MIYHIDKPDNLMTSIAQKIGYTGRKFKLQVDNSPINVKSYWSGGSRDYFTFVRLADKTTIDVPAQSAFDVQIEGAENVILPQGVICVKHVIFCGKDLGLTFIVRPDDATLMLPTVFEDLDWASQVVLSATVGLKSAFRLDEAKRTTGITLAEYNAAKENLIASGHLLKTGAVTAKGRNATTKQLFQLRKSE